MMGQICHEGIFTWAGHTYMCSPQLLVACKMTRSNFPCRYPDKPQYVHKVSNWVNATLVSSLLCLYVPLFPGQLYCACKHTRMPQNCQTNLARTYVRNHDSTQGKARRLILPANRQHRRNPSQCGGTLANHIQHTHPDGECSLLILCCVQTPGLSQQPAGRTRSARTQHTLQLPLAIFAARTHQPAAYLLQGGTIATAARCAALPALVVRLPAEGPPVLPYRT